MAWACRKWRSIFEAKKKLNKITSVHQQPRLIRNPRVPFLLVDSRDPRVDSMGPQREETLPTDRYSSCPLSRHHSDDVSNLIYHQIVSNLYQILGFHELSLSCLPRLFELCKLLSLPLNLFLKRFI